MLILSLSIFFLLVILSATNEVFFSNELFVYVGLLIHFFFISIFLLTRIKKYHYLFVLGFLARCLLMIWDLNYSHIFRLIGSGKDSEAFYEVALNVSDHLELIFAPDFYGGWFTKFNGILFSMVGQWRIFGQYFNVLAGIFTVFFILKTLQLFKIREEIIKPLIIIALFFPNSMIISAIFLRESFITFFVSLSLYFFSKWLFSSKVKHIVWALIFLLPGIALHTGVVGMILGYGFAMLFFDRKSNRFKFTKPNVSYGLILLIVMLVAFILLDDVILNKFQNLQEVDDLYNRISYSSDGGSSYLEGIQVTNFVQFIMYAPIRAFYFISSPLPWDWRGIFDVVSFLIDSILYVYILYYFIANRKKLQKNKTNIIIFLLMIIGDLVIFGVGVSNAGTAMRHRQKLISIFLVFFALVQRDVAVYKEKERYRKKNEKYPVFTKQKSIPFRY